MNAKDTSLKALLDITAVTSNEVAKLNEKKKNRKPYTPYKPDYINTDGWKEGNNPWNSLSDYQKNKDPENLSGQDEYENEEYNEDEYIDDSQDYWERHPEQRSNWDRQEEDEDNVIRNDFVVNKDFIEEDEKVVTGEKNYDNEPRERSKGHGPNTEEKYEYNSSNEDQISSDYSNFVANKLTDKVEVYIYIDETVVESEKEKVDMNKVKAYMEKIYAQNQIPNHITVIDDYTLGDKLYKKFSKETLPDNVIVVKITDAQGMANLGEAGVFITSSNNLVSVVSFAFLRAKNSPPPWSPNMKAEYDLNYQIANTAVHENIHALIYKIIKFYNANKSDFYAAFNLSNSSKVGPGIIGNGHNLEPIFNMNDGFSEVPSFPDPEKERILPEQQFAIRTFVSDIPNSKYAFFWSVRVTHLNAILKMAIDEVKKRK